MMHEYIQNQPTLATERFDLRPLRKADQGLITLYAGDERVARMTSSIPHPLPPGAAEAFILRCQAECRREDVWAIDASKSDGSELAGLIALERMDRNQSEIGFWVGPAYWNSGLAHQAVSALLAANPQENQTIFASVFQDNPASAKVLTDCGFDYLGDAESFSVARDASVATWTYLKRLD